MRYNSRKNLLFIFFLSALAGTCTALPDGLMLNLDFQQAADGLIPSKTLYPLFVPQGELGIETINNRSMLAFQYGQGLAIPHSSLLNPDGHEWIVSVRIFALTDGIVLSQSNAESGYIIYIKDGVAHAAVKTGHTALHLAESPDKGITSCIKDWVTIELRIKPGMATLTLNRKWGAMALLSTPLSGQDQFIRLGNHNHVPHPFEYVKDIGPDGFTGAISSLKIYRQ